MKNIVLPDGALIFEDGYHLAEVWPQKSLERLYKLYDVDSGQQDA